MGSAIRSNLFVFKGKTKRISTSHERQRTGEAIRAKDKNQYYYANINRYNQT
jgi:hypothetical protein